MLFFVANLLVGCSDHYDYCPVSDEQFVPDMEPNEQFDTGASGAELEAQPCSGGREFGDGTGWGSGWDSEWWVVLCEDWCDPEYRGYYCVLSSDVYDWEAGLNNDYTGELECRESYDGDVTMRICEFPCDQWGSR